MAVWSAMRDGAAVGDACWRGGERFVMARRLAMRDGAAVGDA
jgi:hypothetical protein